MRVTRVLVLASGRGTDFQAIVDHQTMRIFKGVVISGMVCNHDNAPVITRAQDAAIPSFVIKGVTGIQFPTSKAKEEAREAFDNRCLDLVKETRAELVVLAGFDQIVSKSFVEACKFKIMNIHPAYDMVRFGGKNMVGKKVHEMVLKSGVGYSGCTIHYVTNDIDGGPVILKKRAEISSSETPESLERRILKLEHLAYPEAIQLVADGRVRVDESGRRCFVDRYSDSWDIDWDLRQQSYIAREREKE